jgi:Transglycosylase-like domain
MVGLLVAIVSGIVAPAAIAQADPVSSARSQIQDLQASIEAQSTHLHQLTDAYNSDVLQADQLQQQVNATNGQLKSLAGQVAQSESTVRQVAVLSYTGAIDTSPSVNVTPLISDEYINVTVGDLSDAEDQLRSSQRQTTTQLQTLRQAEQAKATQVSAAATARQQALNQANSEQQALASDQQQLTALIAAAPPAARPPAVQGLGNNLAKTVQSEVSPTTSTTLQTAPSTTQDAPTTTTAPGTSPASAPATPTTTLIVPVTAPATTVAPTTTAAPISSGGGAGGPWLALRDCESGDNYQENTGNGFYGAYQFSATTWTGLGYPGRPDLEPPAMQDQAAMQLQAEAGWGQWPACSAALGL